jgi:hypothetical protein
LVLGVLDPAAFGLCSRRYFHKPAENFVPVHGVLAGIIKTMPRVHWTLYSSALRATPQSPRRPPTPAQGPASRRSSLGLEFYKTPPNVPQSCPGRASVNLILSPGRIFVLLRFAVLTSDPTHIDHDAPQCQDRFSAKCADQGNFARSMFSVNKTRGISS